MKYTWSNQNMKNTVNLPNFNRDFILTSEYNLKMMDNLQRTSPKKAKRFRSAFTTEQVNQLEEQFRKFPYIGNSHRKEVALALNIPERAVKIWFQNRRMKEKKETFKEFDDELSNRKSLEFPKDQLNNVAVPSANDQLSYSLSLPSDVSEANCDKIVVPNTSCGLSLPNIIQDPGFKVKENIPGINKSSAFPPLVKPELPISPNNYAKSAEFSINLCKKYKNESFSTSKIVKSEEYRKPQQTVDLKSKNYEIEQMIPEDLSSNRKVVAPTINQVPNIAPNNAGYVSMLPTVSPFYAQPYYSASGVIWKPLNVLPAVPSPGSSFPVSNLGIMPTVPASVPKKCCSCDCHVKPLMPYNYQQQPPNPQYLITAVQYPNPSAT